MTIETKRAEDAELMLLLKSPEDYLARKRIVLDDLSGGLGVVKRVRRVAGSAGKIAKRTALRTASVNPLVQAAKLTGKGLALATGPIRRRIFRAFFGKLVNRRARLLSWQARRSLQPTATERKSARTWAVHYIKRRGLFGKLVGTVLGSDIVGAEPVSSTLVAASIPVLIQLARRALKVAERQGAPSDPREAEATDPDTDDQT